jgi:hypothetical protein
LLAAIEKQKALDESLFERLKAAISTFNHQFGVEGYKDMPDPGAGATPPPAQPKSEAPAATTAAKPQAPPKAQAPKKAESEDDRPSQLDQIRAAIADPEPKPKKPKAK